MTERQHEPEMKGWLYKWTNYLRGYQKRWFVLSSGILSYYRTQAEMMHTCRGSISLNGAIIHIDDTCNFVVTNGGTQTFHLKASSEVERQKWITHLELAKVKAVRMMESEEEEEMEASGDGARNDVSKALRILSLKLEDLRAKQDVIYKHADGLLRSLHDLESFNYGQPEVSIKIKNIKERATLFKISASSMINACSEFTEVSTESTKRLLRQVEHERHQRLRLEEMVETLAKQHSNLEEEAKEQMSHVMPSSHSGAQSQSEDEEEIVFEDAVDEFSEEIFIPQNNESLKRSNSQNSEGNEGIEDSSASSQETETRKNTVKFIRKKGRVIIEEMNSATNLSSREYALSKNLKSLLINGKPKRQRRTRVPNKPSYPLNLWSIMKNCIGKELTKIPMPVNFSEPLSFLQRLTEDFEYTEVLNKAASIEDSCEQLTWVAAFTVSSYASTAVRVSKPFNPLLGETYEIDRTEDFGWKGLNEQVSHHPPIVAQHAEGISGWSSWQEFSMSSKFRGKYLQVIPLGISHLTFNNSVSSGNHYTWRKISTTVHNIVVGKLWLDNHGEMEIVNHKTKDKCCLKFIPYSYFSRDTPKKVTGYVIDSKGAFKWFLTGTWDGHIEASKIISQTTRNGKPAYETDSARVLWRRTPHIPESERYYCFTEFACQLNEPEENVSPTDSRHRPDQRLMEEGKWDDANTEKLRLEEKQRAVRRLREAEADSASKEGREYPSYEPVWFRKEIDEITNDVIFKYKGGYWEAKEKQDWSDCPDIY